MVSTERDVNWLFAFLMIIIVLLFVGQMHVNNKLRAGIEQTQQTDYLPINSQGEQ